MAFLGVVADVSAKKPSRCHVPFGNPIAAMLTARSVLLAVLGVCLGRMASRYFRQHAHPAHSDQ